MISYTALAPECGVPVACSIVLRAADVMMPRYTLAALQGLVEAARKYEASGSPVRWGWCR